jgi:bifunctional DNA-binding transcriptional regulator/antitoxin component of YhaV-PrlF toxin-antitoxin module
VGIGRIRKKENRGMIKRTIRKKNQVTVPAQVLKALGDLAPDDEVGFEINPDGTVTLAALTTIPVKDLPQGQNLMMKVGREVPEAV